MTWYGALRAAEGWVGGKHREGFPFAAAARREPALRAAKSRIGGEEVRGTARAAREVEEELSTNCYNRPNRRKRQKQLTTPNPDDDMIIRAMIRTETSSTTMKNNPVLACVACRQLVVHRAQLQGIKKQLSAVCENSWELSMPESAKNAPAIAHTQWVLLIIMMLTKRILIENVEMINIRIW